MDAQLKKLKKKAKKAAKRGDTSSLNSLNKKIQAVASMTPISSGSGGSPLSGLAAAARAARPSERACRDLTAYLSALAHPEGSVGAKVPDLYSYPTATYQSVKTFQLMGWHSDPVLHPEDAVNNGRFCIVACPKLIATDGANTYNAYVMNQTYATIVETFSVTNPIWPFGFDANSMVRRYDDNANVMVPRFSVRDGLAERARAVSMSVWVEYEGPTLNNAGAISASLVSPDVWAHHCSSGSLISYTNWESLASSPGAYQGRVEHGCYVTWRPQGLEDAMFYDTDAGNVANTSMANASYPFIVVSGILPDSAGGAAGQPPIVRARVVTNYEILTSSRVLVSTPSPVCTAQLEVAALAYQSQPAAMANAEHMDWVRRILRVGLGAAAGFVLGGGLPGAALGALAGAGIPNPFVAK